nr:MAG TPA: hypothetical protein [Caudoviricetes sp.]
MKIRTRQFVKYVRLLERLPIVDDEDWGVLNKHIVRRRARINNLREKLLMPESYYPYKN